MKGLLDYDCHILLLICIYVCLCAGMRRRKATPKKQTWSRGNQGSESATKQSEFHHRLVAHETFLFSYRLLSYIVQYTVHGVLADICVGHGQERKVSYQIWNESKHCDRQQLPKKEGESGDDRGVEERKKGDLGQTDSLG